MNSIYVYLIILLSIGISFYLLGAKSTAMSFIDNVKDITPEQIPQLIIGYLSDWKNLLSFGLVLSLGTIISGGNLIAIIPFALLYTLADLFIVPTEEIAVLGEPTSTILILIFKFVMILVMIEFLRGG